MTPGEWKTYRQRAQDRWATVTNGSRPVIWVSADSGALASGGAATHSTVAAAVAELGVDAEVRRTAAFGTTWLEPVVDIKLPGRPRVSYAHVTPDRVRDLLESVLVRDDPRPDLAYANFSEEEYRGIPPLAAMPWWRIQHRLLLAKCGWQDPDRLEDYVGMGGYAALEKALLEMGPEAVLAEVKTAQLRGRGGAGFPAGTKWEGARSAPNTPRYVIVNAHEGEPNVFKDRRLLEGDPHAVVEGLMLAGYAVGSEEGYIYIGSEYPLAIQRARTAVAELRSVGLLGRDILGAGFNFDIKVLPGAGAYISGEASAAIYGIQGEKGMPRTKPPRSAEAGLWGKPTVVNNVETLANVPHIVEQGGEWFRSLGTEKTSGTKVFSLAGDVKHVGLVETRMGVTLRDLIFEGGGGMRDEAEFKAVLAGGISGGALPAECLGLPNEFGSLEDAGAMMGSGGYIIYDEHTCMVDLAFYCTRFNRDESCGKCVPCRVGTSSQLSMLERIKAGRGRERDLDRLAQSSEDIIAYSLCGLGQAAPIPVLSTLRHFREEYLAHVLEKRCPAGVCDMPATEVPNETRELTASAR